jgi:hypothetical protein
MDKAEARDLLLKELRSYRRHSYRDLAERVGTNTVVQGRGPSAAEYTIEVDVFWDSPGSPGKIRVMCSIDDGRLPGAFFPMCGDFIISPDGTFTSE